VRCNGVGNTTREVGEICRKPSEAPAQLPAGRKTLININVDMRWVVADGGRHFICTRHSPFLSRIFLAQKVLLIDG